MGVQLKVGKTLDLGLLTSENSFALVLEVRSSMSDVLLATSQLLANSCQPRLSQMNRQ